MNKLGGSHSSLILAAGLVALFLLSQAALARANNSNSPRSKRGAAKNHSASSGHPKSATPRSATPKSATQGDRISSVEQRLAALGYWTGRVDCVADPTSRSRMIPLQ